MLNLNQRTKAALTEVRGMGAREAKKRLEALNKQVKDGTETAADVYHFFFLRTTQISGAAHRVRWIFLGMPFPSSCLSLCDNL